MFNPVIQIPLLFFAFALMPAYLVWSLWRSRTASRYSWLISALQTGGYLLLAYLIAPWYWLTAYLRYLWLALFLVAAVVSFRRVRDQPFAEGEGGRRWFRKPWSLVELVLIVGALVYTVSGYFTADEAVALQFPLRNGRYYIAHGGSNVLINRHHANRAQQYALDIVEINALGTRAAGIYPDDLDRYVIFGETIHSPCDGTVTGAVDGLPDNVPGETDTENLAGNHVVIACRGVSVVLAHMREGSVRVVAGDAVTVGQPVGAVGNSGNTTEPHLHLHAARGEAPAALGGAGVPMHFGGRFSVRNDILQR